MNYEQTIRQLKERRDFYAAAATAMEKIHLHENGGFTVNAAPKPRKRAGAAKRASAAKREGWAKRREAMDWTPVINTMHMTIREAAAVMGCSRQTVTNRRKTYESIKPNGNGGEPVVSVQ